MKKTTTELIGSIEHASALEEQLDAELERLTHSQKSAPCAIAKRIAASDSEVRRAILAILKKSRVLVGVTCVELEHSRVRTEQHVLFRFSCAGGVVCRGACWLRIVVDLSQGAVVGVVEEHSRQLRQSVIEHTLTPAGALPLALAAPCLVTSGVVTGAVWSSSPCRAEPQFYSSPRHGADVPVNVSRSTEPGTRESAPCECERLRRATPTPTALIVAPNSDEHAIAVGRAVERMGGRAVLIDSADFPQFVELTYEQTNVMGIPFFCVTYKGERIQRDELTGVWWRRPREHRIENTVASPPVREFCAQESKLAFEGWLHLLGERVINPLAAASRAEKKAVQLASAVAAGLTIPETLVSNAPEDVTRFGAAGRDMVLKPFTTPTWILPGARRWRREWGKELRSLRHAPAIFQTEVHPKIDIRVNVIDGESFAVSVQREDETAELDYRAFENTFERHELPSTVLTKIRRLMVLLGLRFAALDFVLQSDGTYVFLEANESGTFLFTEMDRRRSLTCSLARALLRPKASVSVADGIS